MPLLNHNIAELKLKDYDKYLLCQFAPKEKQEQLAAIFNFYQEISQIPLEISEPMVGLIKIQWWRDVLGEVKNGKPPRPHPILLELAKTEIDYDALNSTLDEFANIVEGETPKTFVQLENFLNNSLVKIFNYAAKTLGVEADKNLILAYAYADAAKRIAANNLPEIVVSELTKRANELAEKCSNKNSVLLKITKHRLKNSGNTKLLISLIFCRAILL